MEDKLLFTKIFGLRPAWSIKNVLLDDKTQGVDIYVGHKPDIRVRCPVGDTFYGLYDHAPERVYRPLNTCQMQTYIHVRPTHGISRLDLSSVKTARSFPSI